MGEKYVRDKEHVGYRSYELISAADFLCDLAKITLLIYMSIFLSHKREDLKTITCRIISNHKTCEFAIPLKI